MSESIMTEGLPYSPAVSEAVKYLHESEVWIPSQRYGFSGEERNMAALALRVILDAGNAKQLLADCLITARPAGKLYALCGLYHADQESFVRALERYRCDTNLIDTVSADTKMKERICDIVFSPISKAKGEAKIVLRQGQTVAEWLADAPPGVRPVMDISGGAIPMMLIKD